MTHYLNIQDNDGIELFDLLGTVLGIDLASRQISPLGNGRWEEVYRLFAGDNNTATAIAGKIFDLDKLVQDINDYGSAPAHNTPVWMHEKGEGEVTGVRRSPLFSGNVQPTVEGSVGQFQINNGYVGLLRLERGDWENENDIDLEIYNAPAWNPSVPASYKTSRFNTVSIAGGGSISGRMKLFALNLNAVTVNYFALGIRTEGFGTANFQNCINLGSGISGGTSGTGWLLTAPTNSTEPHGQTNTYKSYEAEPSVAAHTHTVLMNEVSGQTTDAFNEHYVGKYRVILRALPDTLPDAYYKITFSYGYEGNMIENNPVYLTGTFTDYNGYDVGVLNLPNFPYQPNEGSLTDLSGFRFSILVELVGSPAGTSTFVADSLFLIPENGLTLTNIAYNPASSATINLINHPDGSYYTRASVPSVSSDVSFNMETPYEGGVIVYYNECYESYGATGGSLLALDMSYYPKYNSLSG